MKKIALHCLLIAFVFPVKAQTTVDEVYAVVGKYPILRSDIQEALLELESVQKPDVCNALESVLFQKLLLVQADHDSITVSDAEVETELSRRMAYFINKFGSESKMEAFYGKRLNVIKDEFRPDVEERMLSERVLQKISGSSKLTPSEVRQFINAIPTDSLPLINSELELQHMVFKTKISTEAKALAFKTISEFRKRVADGISSMSTMCRLYSEDPGSAKDGGFYANVARGTMVPEFDAVAFRLKPGELSQVFETSYGYHFIQLIQRKGDLLDLRHLLIIPKISNSDRYNTRKLADSVYKLLKSNTLDFETAVKRYSEDAETVQQNGLLINRNNASTRFDNDALNLIDPGLIVVLNPMQEGAVSEPMEFMTDDGKPAYRILKLKSRIPPHKANLKDDYPRLYQMAVQTEQAKSRQEWIKTHVPKTYIRINDTLTCKINSVWTSVK
ncbi:MAG: hypothetical protein RIR05_1568 [Bacteroidota bacterium]|jgi:peptidyl-prolyl cis-trans isomerase SurA|nr:hypothetical protein [Bacteroidia bacterium]